MRKASIRRSTKETDVEVVVDLDGAGAASISTGIGFLDHMLELLARHPRIDLTVKAKGDLHIDQHHTTEDIGIALGQAVKQALGDMKGLTRYADVHVPMDEALTRVALDVSGRAFLVSNVVFVRDGFSLWAFLLAPFWMLRHRLWLAFVAYVIVALAVLVGLRFIAASTALTIVVSILLAVLVGFEAGTLRRFTLSRRGWRNVGIVVGGYLESA